MTSASGGSPIVKSSSIAEIATIAACDFGFLSLFKPKPTISLLTLYG